MLRGRQPGSAQLVATRHTARQSAGAHRRVLLIAAAMRAIGDYRQRHGFVSVAGGDRVYHDGDSTRPFANPSAAFVDTYAAEHWPNTKR